MEWNNNNTWGLSIVRLIAEQPIKILARTKGRNKGYADRLFLISSCKPPTDSSLKHELTKKLQAGILCLSQYGESEGPVAEVYFTMHYVEIIACQKWLTMYTIIIGFMQNFTNKARESVISDIWAYSLYVSHLSLQVVKNEL